MLGNDWDFILKDEINKEYFVELLKKVEDEYSKKTIYPKQSEIFNAFRKTSYKDTKVVILAMDPYPGVYKNNPSACGVAFATENGYINPSLKIIFEELKRDLFDYVNWYNNIRIHGSLNYLTPIEYKEVAL